jgi:hypothetical protein
MLWFTPSSTMKSLRQTRASLARKILDDGMHQEALRSGDESVFERANEYAEMALGKLEQPLFGPEQMGEMRKRLKAAVNAAKAEAEQLKLEKGAAFYARAMDDLLVGKRTFINEEGKEALWFDEIIANQDITPPVKRTLVNMATDGAGVFSAAQQNVAYYHISEQTTRFANGEITETQWWDAISTYGPMLPTATVQPFIKQAVARNAPIESREALIKAAKKKANEEATNGVSGILRKLHPEEEEGYAQWVESPEVAEAVGSVMYELDQWIEETFPPGTVFDPYKARVKANQLTFEKLRELETTEPEELPAEPEPVEKPKKKKQVIPQEVLDQLPDDVRARVLKASPWAQKAFLRAWQEGK